MYEQGDLFGYVPPAPERKPQPARKPPQLKGHAWAPGTGPPERTCKDCAHYVIRHEAKTYRRCWLMRASWTRGSASDIRACDPACLKFEEKDQ